MKRKLKIFLAPFALILASGVGMLVVDGASNWRGWLMIVVAIGVPITEMTLPPPWGAKTAQHEPVDEHKRTSTP
jgi:hypothetical protein